MNVRESVVMSEDTASKQAIGTNHKSARFMLYTNAINAQWAADRIIAESSFPLAEIAFESNRKLFRYQPGDVVRLVYNRFGESIICRITMITEEDLATGKIIVSAVEDSSYVGRLPIDGTIPEGDGPPDSVDLTPLTHFGAMEAPYVACGDDIQVIVTAGREAGIEVGYSLYMSLDEGVSYSKVQNVTTFATYGTLASAYPADTYAIDDTVGFDVIITMDANALQSITRDQLFTSYNMAILGDEIITFQTITPYGADNKYKLEGIYRMRFGSAQVDHSIGEDFYFIGTSKFAVIDNAEFTLGSTIYFKAVPYATGASEDIADAIEVTVTFEGEARAPYDPTNLIVNDEAVNPSYTDDCDIEWNIRVRGEGAGFENPDHCTDEENVWEGLFEIQVYVSDVLVRTTTDIDNDHFTYTEAMNLSDNGSLANEITFKLRNYIDTGSQVYYSEWVTITVVKI